MVYIETIGVLLIIAAILNHRSKIVYYLVQIFSGVLANHYEPPDGFNFDVHSDCPPVQVDMSNSSRLEDFICSHDLFIYYTSLNYFNRMILGFLIIM